MYAPLIPSPTVRPMHQPMYQPVHQPIAISRIHHSQVSSVPQIVVVSRIVARARHLSIVSLIQPVQQVIDVWPLVPYSVLSNPEEATVHMVVIAVCHRAIVIQCVSVTISFVHVVPLLSRDVSHHLHRHQQSFQLERQPHLPLHQHQQQAPLLSPLRLNRPIHRQQARLLVHQHLIVLTVLPFMRRVTLHVEDVANSLVMTLSLALLM